MFRYRCLNFYNSKQIVFSWSTGLPCALEPLPNLQIISCSLNGLLQTHFSFFTVSGAWVLGDWHHINGK